MLARQLSTGVTVGDKIKLPPSALESLSKRPDVRGAVRGLYMSRGDGHAHT